MQGAGAPHRATPSDRLKRHMAPGNAGAESRER